MFLPERVDLDRLHGVVDRIHRTDVEWHRGEGRTAAMIFLMFGEAELGDSGNTYVYVGENEMCAKFTARDFLDLIVEIYPEMTMHKRHLNWFPTMVILPNDQRYYFMGVHTFVRLETYTALQPNRVFFDVSDSLQWELDEQLTEAFQYLNSKNIDVI